MLPTRGRRNLRGRNLPEFVRCHITCHRQSDDGVGRAGRERLVVEFRRDDPGRELRRTADAHDRCQVVVAIVVPVRTGVGGVVLPVIARHAIAALTSHRGHHAGKILVGSVDVRTDRRTFGRRINRYVHCNVSASRRNHKSHHRPNRRMQHKG